MHGKTPVATYIYYHTNGKKKKEGKAIGKKREGVWREWYSNGKLKESAKFENDIIEGKCAAFYSNGNRMEERFYLNGKPTVRKKWNINGILTKNWSLWNEAEKQEYEKLIIVLNAHEIAIKYITKNISDEKLDSFFDEMKIACSGEQLRSAFLDKIHPDFKTHFKKEFCIAMNNCWNALNEEDQKCWEKYQELFGKWISWVEKHQDVFSEPQPKRIYR